MSTRLYLLLCLIFAFLQGSLFSSVFTEGMLVLLLALSRDYARAAVVYLLGGLIFDLVQSQHLGVTSLIFLISGGALYYFTGFLPVNNKIVLALIGVVINVIRAWIISTSFNWSGAFLTFIVYWIILFILERVNPYLWLSVKSERYSIRIR